MSTADELLGRLTEIGATVRPAGDDGLIVRAGGKPVPAGLMKCLRETKKEILARLCPPRAALLPPDSIRATDFGGVHEWHDLYATRTGHWYHGDRRWHEAEALAWGELQNRWNLAYGERVSPEICAGCRRPIEGTPALDLIDGNRVHDVADHDCLIRHGARWRSAATRALVAMGLVPPTPAAR